MMGSFERSGSAIGGMLSYHLLSARSRGRSPSNARSMTTETTRINVAASSGRYSVTIVNGLTTGLDRLLDEAGLKGRRFIVSSPTVWQSHGQAISRSIPGTETILVPDGERFKHLQTVSRIYESLIRTGADRNAVILAVGGGVIGDMAGFAAATYLRGVRLVQIPTTLLAQVDAAIGGKVGVNHALGKNMIGAFHPPRLVAIDPLLLKTLPRREFRAGLYEVIKYGMTSSRALFDRVGKNVRDIFAHVPDVLVPLIAESCAIKAGIVSADEHEAGPRRVLNFGHTVGHAFEAMTRYRRFRHGEAVAYGMLLAADLAVSRGALADQDRQALVGLITKLGPLPSIRDLSARETIEIVHRDKKVVDGKLHFVLAIAIGATTIVDDVVDEELEAALRRMGLRA
jgi:3-dehydroquinate synthase